MRAWICATLFLVGCAGSTPADPTAKQDEYREALAIALDAWQAGKVRDLENRQPPVRFVDDDVVAGLQLMEYTIQTTSRKKIPFQQFSVELKMKDRQGRATTSPALYQVSVTPKISVLRSDL